MADTLRKQATLLALAGGATRAAGFGMRLLFARLMGAEALGVMEMATSVGMLALTPVTAGIPTAMSRMTARRPACDQPEVLRAGRSLVSRAAWVIMPVFLLLSPLIARVLGDTRTLPALMAFTPCVLLLGLGCVYNGYCYGRDETRRAAVNECVEQAVRLVAALALLLCFRRYGVALTAALPGLAEVCAAAVVVMRFRRNYPLRPRRLPPSPSLTKTLFRLAAPTTLSRLCVTGMRTLDAVLLPVCLRMSGLSISAATAQFGLLNGMAMPLMMLPGMVTGAISMVGTPAVSRLEHSPRLIPMTRRLRLIGLMVGVSSAALLCLLAEPIGAGLYRQSALIPLIRVLSPLSMMFGLHQVQYGLIAGLGQQRRALTGTVISSAVTLVLTAWLAPIPQLRLFGAAAALIAGQIINLAWGAWVLSTRLKQLRTS